MTDVSVPAPRRQRAASVAASWPCLGLAVAVWWQMSPYPGIWHDALFYAAEALFRGGLADLSRDPFFAHGSQGHYSVFIGPYAALIRAWGAPVAALAVTALARCLWLAAAWRLARAITPDASRAALALALVLVASPYYEPYLVFSTAEPFATPRPLAEAAAMAGLAGWLNGRRILGAAGLLASMALHPLMGLPALCVGLLAGAVPVSASDAGGAWPWRRQAVALAAGVALLLLLALLGLGPAGQLLQRYDPAWWAVVLDRNRNTLAQAWSADDLAFMAGQWALLALLAWRAELPGPVRHLARAATVAVLSCLLAWLLGSISHDVLLVQLQTWRAMWLVKVLLPLLGLAWLLALPAASARYVALAATAAAAWLASSGVQLVPLLAWLLALLWPGQPLDKLLPARRQAGLALALLALLVLARLAGLPGQQAAIQTLEGATHPWRVAACREPAVWLLIFAGCVAAAMRLGGSAAAVWRASAGLAGLALALGSLTAWLAQARAELAGPPAWMAQVAAALPPGSTVYWDRPLGDTWLGLGRAHYASNRQGAGALFSRAQSLELRARLDRLQALGLHAGTDNWGIDVHPASLDAPRARRLCQDRALDVVLAQGPMPEATRQLNLSSGMNFALFDCAQVRTAAQQE